MVKIGVVLTNLDTLNFEELDVIFDKCVVPILDEPKSSELDLILDYKFESFLYLDNILGNLYTRSRDALLKYDLPLMPINVILYQHSNKTLDETHRDFLYINDQKYKERFNSKQYLIFEEPLLDQVEKPISSEADRVENAYTISALGGTFDHLHDGHKILLTIASFLTKNRLIVGITDKELLVNKAYSEYLESFEARANHVRKFLELIKPDLKIEITPIKDVCGPTGKVPEIEALIVSRETIKGGEFVNKQRQAKGFKPLEICIVNVLGGQDGDNWSEKLSSTDMRKYIAEHEIK